MVVVDNAVFKVDVVFGLVLGVALGVVLAKKIFIIFSYPEFSRFLGFGLF